MNTDVNFDIPLKNNERARVYIPNNEDLAENIEEVIIWLQFLKSRIIVSRPPLVSQQTDNDKIK